MWPSALGRTYSQSLPGRAKMSLTVYDAADIPQGSDAWLEARAGIITASTAGQLITATTIKPASNDKSRGLIATLVAERITGNVEPVMPNRAMERGTLLEPYARAEYEKRAGVTVEQIGFARLDTDAFTLGASPDGLIGGDGGLEIKCPSAKTYVQTVLSGEVPAYNMAQVMACMYVTSRSWWDFVSYYPGKPLFVKRVTPDAHWFDAIAAACEAAEQHIATACAIYADRMRDMPDTEYIDPFAEEEII